MSIRQDRHNQISWQQFSHQLRTADDAPWFDEYLRNQSEEYDESFDFPAPGTRHICTSSSTSTKKRIQPKQNIEVDETNIASSPQHQLPKKAKTRAERRAVEPVDETPTETNLSKHKERRSPYWVQCDDKRRNAARTLKVKFLEE